MNGTDPVTGGGGGYNASDAFHHSHSSVLGNQGQFNVELIFESIGIAIMLFNVLWGAHLCWKRPNRYNAFLLMSATFYLLSEGIQLPITLVSGTRNRGYLNHLAKLPNDSPIGQMNPDWARRNAIAVLQRAYNAFFAFATVSYLLLVQVRFRVLKTIMPYSSVFDILFVVVTLAIWAVTMVLFNIVLYQGSTLTSATMAAIWNVYVLVVDQVLCGVFLYKLADFQVALGQTTSAEARNQASGRRMVLVALVNLAVVAWLCFALFLWSHLGWPNDPGMQTVLFRAATAFSSLTVTSALAFVFAVRRMMTRHQSSARPSRSQARVTIGGTPIGLFDASKSDHRRRESETILVNGSDDTFAMDPMSLFPEPTTTNTPSTAAPSRYRDNVYEVDKNPYGVQNLNMEQVPWKSD
ncbi:hypothetical protein HKX48_009308, partial [Thoreauomyces humboldtii]